MFFIDVSENVFVSPPKHEFLFGKPLVILSDTAGNHIVLRIIGLDDDAALLRMTARAAGRLRDKHETALSRPEVGQIEAGIGTDDTDRRDIWDIVPLRHHLRAEQDIVFLPAEFRQDFLMGKLRIRRITVHANDAR